MADFLSELKQRVLIYDGAMGTSVHKYNLPIEDFWGKENCNEVLVLSRPDVIRAIHASYLEVGCDVIETDDVCWKSGSLAPECNRPDVAIFHELVPQLRN